jgi:hypothetical protein
MMERLEGELRRELDRFGPAGAMGELVAVWPDVVGEPISANAWPARVGKDGTLHVNTADSVWAFELTQQAAAILARLRALLRDRAPTALRFAPGHLPARAPEERDRPPNRPVEPTAEDHASAEALAAPIEDDELRARVVRAAALSLAQSAAGRRF